MTVLGVVVLYLLAIRYFQIHIILAKHLDKKVSIGVWHLPGTFDPVSLSPGTVVNRRFVNISWNIWKLESSDDAIVNKKQIYRIRLRPLLGIPSRKSSGLANLQG